MVGPAQELPRTRFNSSKLIRSLADLVEAEAADAKQPFAEQPFAERLGQWLDVTDAISLSTALNLGAAGGSPAGSLAPSRAVASARDEFARVRTALLDAIMAGGTVKARIKLPLPAPGTTIESADFAPYRRYYLAHQRDFEASIGPLRANVRAAIAGLSPALRQLAVLDAALEKALSLRERNLLSGVPSLLEKRFERLRGAYQAAVGEGKAGEADDVDRWMQPAAWLGVFCKDLQDVLLAELDVRLQPVVGLIEAVGNEVTGHQ